MTKRLRALVTGGAGFIGSHLIDGLLSVGYEPVAYDNLTPQVHGPGSVRPAYLAEGVPLLVEDVQDARALSQALRVADVVLHQAAVVGVGQSMYEVTPYTAANVQGTAVLCEALARGDHNVKKVLLASSMSNYGEGSYLCSNDGPQAPRPRSSGQLTRGTWELFCPECGEELEPVGTTEDKPLHPTSVYATTKRDQEELLLNICRAYDIPMVAFRYFNAYGTRQSLSNPYTGVAAIFASQILNNRRPLVYEDGGQSRDFVHVTDIVQANILALDSDVADGRVLNVGTGRKTQVRELANLLIDCIGRSRGLEPEITGQGREGDIRHCFADISSTEETLGYSPTVSLEDGVEDLVAWAKTTSPVDHTGRARAELARHGLVG